MTYEEQMKSPKWQRKRLEIMDRDGFKCRACGRDDMQLHVHHRGYIKGRFIWEYTNDMLVTLCDVCHKKTHEILPPNVNCNGCGMPVENNQGYGQTNRYFWCEDCTMQMEKMRIRKEFMGDYSDVW